MKFLNGLEGRKRGEGLAWGGIRSRLHEPQFKLFFNVLPFKKDLRVKIPGFLILNLRF